MPSAQKWLVCLLLIGLFAAMAQFHQLTHSASLSAVSATLSNSRPSFRGALSAGNAEGTSQVLINTTAGAYPSTSAAQLVEGDSVSIGTGGGMGSFVVTDVLDDGSFTINGALGSGMAATGTDVISTQSADLSVRFTTTNAVQDGSFRVLVPAHADDTTASDQIPDGGTFDMGTTLGDHGQWIRVPASTLYGTGDFLVMKYEAKAWNTSTDTVVSDGGSSNGWAGSNTQTTYRARSIPEGLPWRYIAQNHSTEYDALEACADIGTRLITNHQWMTIARNIEQVDSNWTGGSVGSGALYSGHNDNNPVGTPLAASSDDTLGYTGTNNTSPSNQRRTLRLSNGAIIWDIAGNVWQWTDDTIMGANKPVGAGANWTEWTTVSSFGTLSYDLTRPSNTSWNSSQGVGQYYQGSASGGPYAFLRGGYWNTGSPAGAFTLSLDNAPVDRHNYRGFRCASDHVAISEAAITAPKVTCPGDLSGYSFDAPSSSSSLVTIDGADYHSFVCPYTGTGAVGTAFDGSSEDPIIISDLINPAPSSDHTQGTADTFPIIVQHLDSSNNIVDQTTTQIGLIEAVKVTASVEPLITFRIIGVASGQSRCGQTTSITTSPTEVSFGSLLIDQFRYAAQSLTVSTNAANGYAVTARANDQMGRNGGACTGDPGNTDPTNTDCIPDSTAPNISHTNPATWNSANQKGLGYSLHDLNTSGTTPAFQYNTNSGNCAGSECYKQFADGEDSELPQTIFSSSAPADNHNLDVCYKAIISPTQAAGNYENYVTYTATATF